MIKINGIYYTVVGQSKPLTQNINVGGSAEERISVPLTTLQQSNRMGDKIHSLAITAQDDISISDFEDNIKKMVKVRHQISPDDPQAIDGFNVEKIFRTFQSLAIGINILIWIVGLGTLLAGVVGISNIMLVTVRERTQEFGIRRA